MEVGCPMLIQNELKSGVSLNEVATTFESTSAAAAEVELSILLSECPMYSALQLINCKANFFFKNENFLNDQLIMKTNKITFLEKFLGL